MQLKSVQNKVKFLMSLHLMSADPPGNSSTITTTITTPAAIITKVHRVLAVLHWILDNTASEYTHHSVDLDIPQGTRLRPVVSFLSSFACWTSLCLVLRCSHTPALMPIHLSLRPPSSSSPACSPFPMQPSRKLHFHVLRLQVNR